jgi:hypothetical protein
MWVVDVPAGSTTAVLQVFLTSPEKHEISLAEGNKQMDGVINFEGNSVLFDESNKHFRMQGGCFSISFE